MKSIYNTRIILTISLLIIFTISCVKKPELTWQKIADKNWDNSYFIKEDEAKDRNSLIIYLATGYYYERKDELDVQRILKLRDEKVFNEPFDPLLAILYYYHHVNTEEIKDNTELLKVLLKFKNYDRSNALPYYLLSYYYALDKDPVKTIRYLKEGNEYNNINLYNSELHKLIFDYYINKTNNEVFSYLISILSTNHTSSYFTYFRKYIVSNKTYIKHGNKYKRVIVEDLDFYKLGENITNNSVSHIDLLLGTAIQLNSLDVDETQRINDFRNIRRRLYLTTDKLNFYERTGKKEYLNFLKDYYKYGEIKAFMNIKNYNNLLTQYDIDKFCDDWSTKIFHFPDDDNELKKEEGWVNTFTRVMECEEEWEERKKQNLSE